MIDDSDSRRCENTLLEILPLFESAVTDPEPNAIVQADNLSDHERRARSFNAKFLAELRSLRKLIEHSRDHETLDRNSDGFVKNLRGILTLFDCYVGDEVEHALPGPPSGHVLKLGDHRFYRLGALSSLLATGTDGERFVTRITLEAKHKENMAKIQKYIRRLERFLSISASDPEMSTSDKSKWHPSYEVRQFLGKLHDLLVNTWSTCQNSHQAKIRLTTFGGKRPKQDESETRDFDLLLQTHTQPCHWKQSRITIHSELLDSTAPAVKSSAPAQTARFLKGSAPKTITKLCSVIDALGLDKSCLCIKARHTGLTRVPAAGLEYLQILEDAPSISLKALIESAPILWLKQKRILAVILAYSLIHLGESCWLKDWTTDDVHFCQSGGMKVDLARPFLSAQFSAQKIQGCGGDDLETDDEDEEQLAPSLLAFGIMLLELETGKSIDSFLTAGDLTNGKRNPYSNISAASRLVEPSKIWNANDGIRKAAEACISRTFLTIDSEAGATELGFQRAVYSNIVAPIERDLLASFDITAESLDSLLYCANFEYRCSHTGVSRTSRGLGKRKEKAQEFWYQDLQTSIRHVPNPEEGSDSEESSAACERIVDSQVLIGTETNNAPPEAKHAKTFFKKLKKIQQLLDAGRTSDFIPVKVAILDTGIHPKHGMRGKITDYYDFVDSNFVYNGEETLTRDDSGHGSDMVELLHKTAPWAEIYVARVFEKDDGDADTALHAAKAIEHARDQWKVDIISMSFGFIDDKRTLQRVIDETKTLMFAASSNFGATEDNPIRFPARMNRRVICVNAADGNGYPSRMNPPDHAQLENFSILGECVPVGKVKDPETGEARQLYKSGTSIATPIAAGVAALVLEFALQPGMHRQEKSAEELQMMVDELKTFDGMSSVIRRMTRDGRKGGYRFISPGKVLLGDPKLPELERYSQSDNIRVGAVCATITDSLREKYHCRE